MKRWFRIIVLLGLLVAIAACKPSGNSLASVSMLPTPTVISLLQSPLATPTAVPLAVPITAPTATPIPTATPMTVPPPPPDWPTGVPWPPKPSTQIPLPTQTRPIHTPIPTPVGSRPAQLQALYYLADNNGTPELHSLGLDQQGRKWSETNIPNLLPSEGYTLHASPDGKYLAIDFAYGGLRVLDLSSGRIWCVLEDKQGECHGGFGDWLLGDRLLLRATADMPSDMNVVPGGVLIININTRQYEQLDLPVQAQFGYSLVQEMSLSPDRSKLAYSIIYPENRKEISEIWVMRLDTKDRQLVRKVEAAIKALAWSPTDDRLLCLCQPGTRPAQTDPTELWLMNSDGTNAKLLVGNLRNLGNGDYKPAWSPDGHHVAFVRVDNTELFLSDPRGPGTNVYVVDTTTGDITKLSAFEDRHNDSLTWSPDGKFVAFASSIFSIDPNGETPGYTEIWVASVDGSQLRAVSGMARWGSSLAWLPAGSSAQGK